MGKLTSLHSWRKSSYTNCFEYTEKNGFEDPFSALPFDCYREQLLLPGQRHSDSLALNLPRSITNKVFKGGLSALSPEDRALLPPYFHRGNDKYYQRFRENILGTGQHGPISEETIDNMFWAQSLWDETMAWTASQYMQRQPHAILVILVGDFHAQYGGGLPAQLKSRGTLRVHTVSQMAMAQASMDEMKEAAAPHLQYGERADLTIITNVQ